MASSYTSRLKLERQTSGENSGTWGDLVNYTFNRLDAGIDGWANVNVAGSTNVTLTSNNSTLNTDDSTTDDELHNRTLELFGTLTGNINVFTGDVENSFTVFNNTTGSYTLTFGPTTGTGVTLAQGAKTIVYSDGSTMLDVMADLGDVSAITVSTSGNVSATGTVSSAGNVVATTGKQTMWVPAVAMYGSETNGADAQQVETTALSPDLKVLDFDASTSEFAQFAVTFPKSWNGSSVTFIPTWSPSNTDTGNCIWSLSGLSVAEGETADTSFSAPQTSTDAGIGTVKDIQMGPVSSAITIAGTIADGNQVFFQLERDADNGSDTFTGDARLLGIQLFYTTDAANDA